MRVLIFLLVIVLTTALSIGASLLIALQLADAPNPVVVLAAGAVPFLVMGPLLLGALSGAYDHRASEDARRVLRRWFVGVGVVDAVAAGCVVVATTAGHAPVWVPVVLVGGAAVLLAVARPLGALVRRTEPPLPETLDGTLPGPDEIRRKVLRIAVTFVVAAVLATIGVVLLVVLGGERGPDVGQVVLLAGQLTFLATAMAALLVALPLSRALRDVGGRDAGRLRRFGQVVLRGKDVALDATEERNAAQWARIVPLALQFQLAYVGLLYLSIAFQMLSQIVRGDLGAFPVVMLVLLVAVLVWAVPQNLRRIRRARRYAERHAPDAGLAQVPTA